MKKAFVLLVGVAWLAGCGGEGGTLCEVGKTEDCLKGDNTAGKKRCIDGAWSACGDYCDEGPPSVCTTTCGSQGSKTCGNDGQWGDCVAVELCNGLDDNCDGQKDENLTQACFCGSQQGTQTCVLGQWTPCDKGTAQSAELCDGLDNDCDSLTDEECDKDHDMYCDFAKQIVGTPAVCPKGGQDCDDNNINVNPGKEEKCNGFDDDCDTDVDEDLGTMACGGEGECTELAVDKCQGGQPVLTCTPDTLIVGAKPEVDFGCDSKDNDCDGATDEQLGCCTP
ncbi:MAG: hypothetical protein FJ109_21805, partial [Deltaproteobacteria bacterium]|nr:hypothetical protein [Deltaproteobacteria bacterium]